MTEWTDDQVKVFISIEKRLCEILGKAWRSAGMSTDTLLDDVASEMNKLREKQGVCKDCGRVHECPRGLSAGA